MARSPRQPASRGVSGPSRPVAPASVPAEPHTPSLEFRIALGLIFVMLALLALRQVSSLDVGFHLRAGERVLAGEGWPRSDPFTYTVSDHPYIDTSWGYQVLLSLLERAFGAPGLVLFHAALALAIFVLLALIIRLGTRDETGTLLVLFLGGVASELRFEVRPELLSYALLALVLYLLARHAQGLRTPLWLLPVVFLAWANCHSLFILGWCAIACYLVGGWLARGRLERELVVAAALSVVVTLVNPYGWKALVFPFTLATRLDRGNPFGQSIGEFVSPFDLGLSEQNPFYPRAPIFAFRVLFALVVLALPGLVRRKRWAAALLALPFLYLSFKMIRNMPLLAVGAGAGAVWGLDADARLRSLVRRPERQRWLRRAAAAVLALSALVIGLRVRTDAYYIASRREDRFGWSWNRSTQPVAAAEWAAGSRLTGRMLNHLNFGGYLMWALRQPVFIDGRLEVMGEPFYQYYRQALASQNDLEACVARYGIGWIVFPYLTNGGLLGRLSGDSRWRLAYADDVAAVFARRDGEGDGGDVGGPGEPAPPPLDIGSLPGLGGPARSAYPVRWLSGLLVPQRFPANSFNRGLFHYFRGEPESAARFFAQAIRDSGGAYYENYNNLGSALYRLGRRQEAAACYRIVLQESPGNRYARERLAGQGP